MKSEARNPKSETNPNNGNFQNHFGHSSFELVSDLLRMSRRLGFDIRISDFPP